MTMRRHPVTPLEVAALFLAATLAATFVVPERFRVVLNARAEAHDDMNAIRAALETYRYDNGDYPTNAQGLAALLQFPATAPRPRRWFGPYIVRLPRDPWGSAYRYRHGVHAGSYALSSLGADRAPGGAGPGSDLTAHE